MASDIPIVGNIDPATVARFGVGGVLTGAATASALNLVHMIRSLNEKRVASQTTSETDENTIVLTIPKKTASCNKSHDKKDTKKSKKGDKKDTKKASSSKDKSEQGVVAGKIEHKTKDKTDNSSNDAKVPKVKKAPMVTSSVDISKQLRHYDGKYGKKMSKKANWQTLAASVLAVGGGGTLGYMIVDKLYEMKRMKDKEKELDTARQEYLDKLKPREADNEKISADKSRFSTLDYPLGIAALALLLGSGSTAWLTKRVLDEYNQDGSTAPKKPEVERIVFKSAADLSEPESEQDKVAAETGSALINIYLDICSGTMDVVGDDKIAEVLKDTGYTQGDIYKMAAAPAGSKDYQDLLATLDANPDFRRTLQRIGMEKHPILKYLKWSVGLPFVRDIADKKLYTKIEDTLGPSAATAVSKAAEWEQNADPELVKQAIFGLNLRDIGASYAGSSLAETAMKNKAEAEEEEEVDPKQRAEDILSKLQIATADEDAQKFVAENADKIRAVIGVLAEKGKL